MHRPPALQNADPTHSVLSAQVVRHWVVSSQRNGLHGVSVSSPQLPLPAHVADSVSVSVPQLWSRHEVSAPGKVQVVPFTPLQVPAQTPPSLAHGARPPTGSPLIGSQVPTEPVLHASHCPSQATSQHTPSTQSPVWHCSSAPHALPFGRSGSQTDPLLQKKPTSHSSVLAQVAAQTSPLHP